MSAKRGGGLQVHLAPGASGGEASIRPYITGLEKRGLDVAPVTLPRGPAERAVATFLSQSGTGADIVIGGRSFGARVATLAAAQAENEFAALLLFAYPLHPPGKPNDVRTSHWPLIRCPVLIAQGDSDPFGTADEVGTHLALLPSAELVPLAGTGHTLSGRLEEALDAAAAWLQALKPRASSGNAP